MTKASHRVSLAAGVLPEFTPLQTIDAAARAGWRSVGIWIDLEAWNAGTTREVSAALRASGLAALDAEVVWLRSDTPLADYLRKIDIAVELQAENILIVSSLTEASATAALLDRLATHLKGAGPRLSLEFGAFTAVKSLADALGVIGRLSGNQVGILVDPLHFARTGGHPVELAAVEPSRFAYAQFCDAKARGPNPVNVQAIIEEAIDGRLMPGDGALPLRALLDSLPEGIPLSVELRSKELRDTYPNATDRARALLIATNHWFERHQNTILLD